MGFVCYNNKSYLSTFKYRKEDEMVKKWNFRALLLILLIIGGSYFISISQPDFFEVYQTDDDASKSLQDFLKKPLKKIIINNEDWNYYVEGTSEKAILFIHGMGGAYNLWWQQADFFKNEYKVITFTLPENINNLEDASNGILKILAKENIDKLTIVGTSMGGYIAQYLTHKIPNRIEKAVYSNTFPPNKIIIKDSKKQSDIIPYLPEIVISKFGEKKLNTELIPAGKNSKLLAAFLPSLPFSKKQFINRYAVVIDYFRPTPTKYEIKRIPKLIIESDNDPLIKKELRELLKELYPKANVKTLHNEGHFPYINAANEFNKTLKQFFGTPNSYQEVENTVQNYFEGRKTANLEQLQKAFTKTATLFTVQNKKQLIISFSTYLEKVKNDGKKNVKTTIIDGDINNNIAIFKTSFKYTDTSYQDYLTLLKINGNWKITTKTFQKIK